MMARLMIAMVAVLLLGGFATSIAPPVDTTQTVEAKKNKKNDNSKKDRKQKKDRRDNRRENRAVKAFSYINPDTGLATENPDVDADSECESPDQRDTQQLSASGSTANNVHNDACLFKKKLPVDTAVSFEINGVGEFSACPDPDGAGPKTATNSGSRCYLTGYQETGMAGDQEYHSRINNDETPGTSYVTFCADADNNGCGDEKTKDRIEILWVA